MSSQISPNTKYSININNENNSCTKLNIIILKISSILIIFNIIISIAGFQANRPAIYSRLHEACMWESGKSKKFYCVDKGEATCEPIKNIYPELKTESEAYNYIYKYPTRYSNEPIYWRFNETSICICLDGYNVHLGECKKFLPEWPETIGILIVLSFIVIICNGYIYLRYSYLHKLIEKYNYIHITLSLIFAIILFIWSISNTIYLQTEYSDYP